MQWRRPGADFGGTKFFFADQDFWMMTFFGKNVHFHAKNFWWPFFSHRPDFSDFPYLYCIECMWPFLHKKNHYSRKEFLDNTFFTLFVLSRASDNTILLKILRDGCMGRSPNLKFLGGPFPQSPLGLRPCLLHLYICSTQFKVIKKLMLIGPT